MKVIGQKLWNEPAACIGLLVTLALLVLNLIGDDEWTAQTIIEVLAPLAASLGIRQAVIPMAKLDELTAPSPGTTYAGHDRA